MARLKKFGAAAVAAAMAAMTLAGCSDTRYVVSYGDKKVNSGIYLYNMLNEMQNQIYVMTYMQGVKDNFFDQKVDEKDFSTYLTDYSNEKIREYAVVVDRFEKLGLSLTDEEIKEISDSINKTWQSSGEMLEAQGISKESAKLAEKEAKMYSKLFDHFYAEGGEEEVKSEDMVKYINDNYVRYKTITIAKSTLEDEKEKNAADEESKKLIEKYLKKANKVSFDDFDKIIEEYNKEINEQADESTSESGASTDSSSSSAADDTSSTSESSSASDTDTSSVSDSEVTSSTAVSGGEMQAVSSTDSSSDDSLITFDPSDSSVSEDGAEQEEQEDPYANETMYNFTKMSDKAKEGSFGKFIEKIKEMKADKAESYEDEDSFYIIIKGDVSKRAESYAEENKSGMLSEMKSDDFKKKLEEWGNEIGIKENTASFKRYTPKDVYERWTEYLNDNSEQ